MTTPVRRIALLSCAAPGVALLASVVAVGCQTAVPRDLAGMKSVREEQKIVKLAKRDPFPSPADVGLDAPTSVP